MGFIVLGGQTTLFDNMLVNAKLLTANQDANDLGSGYYYSFSSAVIGSIANIPSGLSQEIIIFSAPRLSGNMYGYQILMAIHQDAWFIRHFHNKNAWSDWAIIDTNIPTFYKDYNNLASLATALSAVFDSIPQNADLNNYTANGIYICGGGAIAQTVTNCPISVAFRLDVLYFSSTVTIQRIISSNADNVYIRTKISNNWGSWYKYQGTVVS